MKRFNKIEINEIDFELNFPNPIHVFAACVCKQFAQDPVMCSRAALSKIEALPCEHVKKFKPKTISFLINLVFCYGNLSLSAAVFLCFL